MVLLFGSINVTFTLKVNSEGFRSIHFGAPLVKFVSICGHSLC